MKRWLGYISFGSAAALLSALTLFVTPGSQGQSQRGECQKNCTDQYQQCRKAANANTAACKQAFDACKDACRAGNTNGNVNGNTNTNTNGNTNGNVNGNTNSNTNSNSNTL